MISVKKPNFRVETSVPKEKQVRDAISEETLTAIFERFPEGSPAHLPLKLCCMAGLRVNEALGLAWSDIDFEKHRMFVRRQIVKIQKEHELTPREKEMVEKHLELASFSMTCSNPKYDSKRVIPLFPELEELLLRERKRQIEQKALFEETGVEYKQYFYTKATAPSYTLDYEEFIVLHKDNKKLNTTPGIRSIQRFLLITRLFYHVEIDFCNKSAFLTSCFAMRQDFNFRVSTN